MPDLYLRFDHVPLPQSIGEARREGLQEFLHHHNLLESQAGFGPAVGCAQLLQQHLTSGLRPLPGSQCHQAAEVYRVGGLRLAEDPGLEAAQKRLNDLLGRVQPLKESLAKIQQENY